MRTLCSLPRLFAAALLALLFCWPAAAGTPVAGAFATGYAKGAWHLPEPPAIAGDAQGVLYTPAGLPLYTLDAQLTEIVSPCLSCREGDLHGTLDDGIGPGPDFVVQGHWIVSQFTGQGSFDATIWKPTGPALTPVGRLIGLVDDPPFPPGVPGTFSARWALRR